MVTYTRTQLPVIIVGGGLSGLSAAALLARAGHTVTLFEKAHVPGGRARTKQHGGFSFNQGAHAFYLGGPGEKLLSELGVHWSGSKPALDTSLALEGEKVYAWPTTAAAMAGANVLTSAAQEEFVRVLSMLKQVKLTDLENVSLQEWLERQVHHPQVRLVFLAGARTATYANAPELLSASLGLSFLTAQVQYLDRGWQTLVDGLWQTAQDLGARIVTQARVVAITVVREGYSVRLADGTCYAASAVLLATDPETACALVMDGTHEELRRWAAQSIPARTACFDLALRRLPRPQNLFAMGMDCPLYYSVHSASANLAPQGNALIHAMKYLRPDELGDPEATRQELEAAMDLLQPGWRAKVVEQCFLPHMIASNAIVQAKLGGLSGRPGPMVPRLPNLYVAGDWVGTEGELADACFASARSAARLIMAHLTDRQSASLASSLGVIE